MRTLLVTALPVLLIGALIAQGGPRAARSAKAADDAITEEREVSPFTKLDVSGPGSLVVTVGEAESLTITALQEDLDRIRSEVRADQLVIMFEGGRLFGGNPKGPIRYEVTVVALDELRLHGAIEGKAAGLEAAAFTLELSGAATLELAGLATDELEVELSGSSELRLSRLRAPLLEADLSDSDRSLEEGGQATAPTLSLKIDLSGSSRAEFSGAVEQQEVEASGASEYDAADLDSRVALVEASGASNVTVRVRERLDVAASGASVVEYIGEDVAVSRDTSGSSEIIHLPYRPLPAPPPSTPEP